MPTEYRDTTGLPITDIRARSPDRKFPGAGTQLNFDPFRDRLPHMTGPGLRNKLPGMSDYSDLTWAPKSC